MVERNKLRIHLNYETTENGNAYGDNVQRITGIYCPITGNDSLIVTRTTQYKIVPKRQSADGVAVDVGFSGGNAAPRSSVNNCTRDPATSADGLEHADHEVGETVNLMLFPGKKSRELAQRLSDDVRTKRKTRPPEREEGAGLSVKEQQISELLALRGIDASTGIVRSTMAGASIACGDLVLTMQNGRLVSSNRAASGIDKLASEKMAVKKKSDKLLNRWKVAVKINRG